MIEYDIVVKSTDKMGALENEDNNENCSYLMDVGFMFDACEKKVTKTFEFGKDIVVSLCFIEQEPGAVQSGHYVWPAAPALCEYLVKTWSLQDKIPVNIVELGAGCGLAGLCLSQLQPKSKIIFTDHDPGVLKTIEHNLTLQNNPQAVCLAKFLQWGEDGKKEVEEIKSMFIVEKNTYKLADLIVGTDVIYAKEIVSLLFWTVNELLHTSSSSKFLMCSSFSYDESTEKEINNQCHLYGFNREIIQCNLNVGGVRIQGFFRV